MFQFILNKIVSKLYILIHRILINLFFYRIFYFRFKKVKLKIKKNEFPVHMLVCDKDYKMSLITLFYFLKSSGLIYDVFIHDDGSLSKSQEYIFRSLSPEINYISRSQSDDLIQKELKEFQTILKWRQDFPFALKLIDLYFYSSSLYYIYLDSDILFFRKPIYLNELVKKSYNHKDLNNFFNKDIESAYVTSEHIFKDKFGIDLKPRLNAGLIFINKSIFNFSNINWFLENETYLNFEASRKHVSEQTLYAILTSISNTDTSYLPIEYDVSLNKSVPDSVTKHYVGKIRYKYSLEGLISMFLNK